MLSKTSNKLISIEYFKHEGYHNVKCISKKLGYRNNRGTRRRECIPEFLLFRGVRWRGLSHHKGRSQLHKGSPYYPMNCTTKDWFTFNYRNPSRRNPEPLQQRSGAHTHNWIRGSRTAISDHKRSQPPQSRLGSKDPRVTSSQAFNFHESSWRAQTDATKQWQEHKCSNPSLSNPTKSN